MKTSKGMMGERATFHSMRRNRTYVTAPKTIRLMTVGEVQGYAEPPKLRPRSNMTVPPTTVRHPSQSNAFNPARRGVLGVLSFKVVKTMPKTTAVQGTEPGQSLHMTIGTKVTCD